MKKTDRLTAVGRLKILFNNRAIVRLICYFVVVFLLTSIIFAEGIYCSTHCSSLEDSVVEGGVYIVLNLIVYIWGVFALLSIIFVIFLTLIFFFFLYIYIPTVEVGNFKESNSFNHFLYSWMRPCAFKDDRSAVQSALYVLKIGEKNTLKLILWLPYCFWWMIKYPFNYKLFTRMVILLLFLYLHYQFSAWLSYEDPTFWLRVPLFFLGGIFAGLKIDSRTPDLLNGIDFLEYEDQ